METRRQMPASRIVALLDRARTAIQSTASSVAPSVWPEIDDRDRYAQQSVCDAPELANVFDVTSSERG
jgi:hypothetical protein